MQKFMEKSRILVGILVLLIACLGVFAGCDSKKSIEISFQSPIRIAKMVPIGNGAKDLAQPSFITSRSSEITTDPSAAIPQYSFTPPSEPCNQV